MQVGFQCYFIEVPRRNQNAIPEKSQLTIYCLPGISPLFHYTPYFPFYFYTSHPPSSSSFNSLSLLQSLSLYFLYHNSLVSTRVFQFSSSLLLISQMYCISLHHFAVFSYSTFFVHCKPIYSPSKNADSIKQCPKSTQLSEYE